MLTSLKTGKTQMGPSPSVGEDEEVIEVEFRRGAANTFPRWDNGEGENVVRRMGLSEEWVDF